MRRPPSHHDEKKGTPVQDSSDVVVYGGTPAGVVAAVAAARAGASVRLVEPSGHVGGLLTSGLNTAEAEHMLPESFSGLPLEFYRRIGAAYGRYVPLFHWESRVAEQVFLGMLREAGVELQLSSRLDGVDTRSGLLDAAELATGERLSASSWVDASYEGDLMAAAGVPYRIGRESRAEYGESLAGMRFNEADDVEPYWNSRVGDELIDVAPYGPDGRLLPGFVDAASVVEGAADSRTMNYHFRITLSTGADRLPIERPDGFDREQFAILATYLAAHPDTRLDEIIDFYPFPSGRYGFRDDGRTDPHPGEKWEINNRQAAVISLGHFGGQVGYLEADAGRRREIVDEHRRHNQGLLHFLAHDPAVPPQIRADMGRFGLPADEYLDNGGWPYQLYVREGRRMVGRYVLTQRDLLHDRVKADAVAVGSHWIDSHHVQRVAVSRTQFRNEGRIWVALERPYHLPFGVIVPPAGSVQNLAVPVCASASHVAYSSIRLETTWMALGQAAGAAAALGALTATPLAQADGRLLRGALADVLHLDELPR